MIMPGCLCLGAWVSWVSCVYRPGGSTDGPRDIFPSGRQIWRYGEKKKSHTLTPEVADIGPVWVAQLPRIWESRGRAVRRQAIDCQLARRRWGLEVEGMEWMMVRVSVDWEF